MRAIKCWAFFLALIGGHLANASCFFSGQTGPVKTPLMVSIWRGEIEAVSKLLMSSTSLNIRFNICRGVQITPLMSAILANSEPYSKAPHETHQKMIEILLSHGASPDYSAGDFGPLHMAASLDDLPTVQLLLRYGASVDLKPRDKTPLLVAVQDGSAAVARELIAAGANIEVHDSLGANLVAIAASQQLEDVVKLLVQLGVDPCARDKEGRDAINWAVFGWNDNDHIQRRLRITAFLNEKCWATPEPPLYL